MASSDKFNETVSDGFWDRLVKVTAFMTFAFWITGNNDAAKVGIQMMNLGIPLMTPLTQKPRN